MSRTVIRKAILTGVLFALVFSAIFVPRFIGIKKFTTGDEPAWLMFAHNFLHAVDRGQFERTAYDYHPAVTTLWEISAAILSYFPEYTQIRHGYIDKFWELDDIYAQYGKALSTVMYRSKMINVGIISLSLLLAFALLRKLMGNGIALAAVLLVAFDPFYLGQSRLLNHEGIAATFTLVSIFAMLVFLNQGRKFAYLLISGCGGRLGLINQVAHDRVGPFGGVDVPGQPCPGLAPGPAPMESRAAEHTGLSGLAGSPGADLLPGLARDVGRARRDALPGVWQRRQLCISRPAHASGPGAQPGCF